MVKHLLIGYIYIYVCFKMTNWSAYTWRKFWIYLVFTCTSALPRFWGLVLPYKCWEHEHLIFFSLKEHWRYTRFLYLVSFISNIHTPEFLRGYYDQFRSKTRASPLQSPFFLDHEVLFFLDQILRISVRAVIWIFREGI